MGHEDDREAVRAFASSAELPALREVRIVQLNGGIQAGRKAPALARRADELAGEFNRLRGEEVATVQRPFAQRFPLNGDVGYGILAGHVPGGRPAIALPGDDNLALVLFDHDGRFTELRLVPPACDQDDLQGRARDEFGFELGVIYVHEFTTNPAIPRRRQPWYFANQRRPKDGDIAVCKWSYSDARVVDAPDRRPQGFSMNNWRQSIRSLHGWMDDRDFIIDCWNDYWAGAGGVITAS
jgi:hypothetical protein